MHVLQSLLLISDKLSTRLDHLICMNLQVSINFILNGIASPLSLSYSFLIGTEKVIYFSIYILNHHEFLQEFLGVLYNVNYKCYEQLL